MKYILIARSTVIPSLSIALFSIRIFCLNDIKASKIIYASIAEYFPELEDIIVISDDMALEPGRIRIRSKGSSGGHNGLKDIIARLGSSEFTRLRVGIGQSEVRPGRDHVLSRPGSAEGRLIEDAVEKAAGAVLCWIEEGVDIAMNRFNTFEDNR